MRRFDGAALFGKVAGFVLLGWLCSLPFIGIGPGLVMLVFLFIGLRILLGFYNRQEQRDIDDFDD